MRNCLPSIPLFCQYKSFLRSFGKFSFYYEGDYLHWTDLDMVMKELYPVVFLFQLHLPWLFCQIIQDLCFCWCFWNKENFLLNRSLDCNSGGKTTDRGTNILLHKKVLLHCPSNTSICSTYFRKSFLKATTWSPSLLLLFSSIVLNRGSITPRNFPWKFSKILSKVILLDLDLFFKIDCKTLSRFLTGSALLGAGFQQQKRLNLFFWDISLEILIYVIYQASW